MDNGTLYSTIATINGVWISLLFSLGLVLFTHVVNQNITFFTSMRKEKKKLLDNHISLNSMHDLINNIGKHNEMPDDEAKSNLSTLLESIGSKYTSIKFQNEGATKKAPIVRRDLQDIFSYYPQPNYPEITFKHSEKTRDSNEYTKWLQKYRTRFDFIKLGSALLKISNANPIKGGTFLGEDNIIALKQVEDLQKAVTDINNSIETIESLHVDYELVQTIMGQVKPILNSSAGVLLVGVLLPIYMLLPYRIDVFPESIVIGTIFISLAILYIGIVAKINKIMKPILKYES